MRSSPFLDHHGPGNRGWDLIRAAWKQNRLHLHNRLLRHGVTLILRLTFFHVDYIWSDWLAPATSDLAEACEQSIAYHADALSEALVGSPRKVLINLT